jgi:hypothetical protein
MKGGSGGRSMRVLLGRVTEKGGIDRMSAINSDR